MSFEKEKCPYCESECEADWVDIGIGYTQCGPYYCEECGASEIGSFDDIGINKQVNIFYSRQISLYGRIINHFIVPKESSKITQEEFDKGWYKPHSPMGSSVNTCNGKYVKHKEAEELYKLGLLDEKATKDTGK